MEVKVQFYKENPEQEIFDTLRAARRKMGYTQAYVAECIGMSTRQYIKYENGQLGIGEISFQQGINLCELLHVEVYQLIRPIEQIMTGRTVSA